MPSEKKQLRKFLIAERKKHSIEKVRQNSRIISQKLFELEEIRRASTISTFLGKQDEVQTKDIIKKSWAAGIIVIVPVVDTAHTGIYFSKLSDMTDLSKGHYDVLEPRPDKISVAPLASAEVVLVPGVGWDPQGHRLGYGKGFYDQALRSVSSRTTTVGLAFDWQVQEKIPVDVRDVPVDMIVTELRTIACSNRDLASG